MPTIYGEVQVSGQELLRAVEQLNPSEFQSFVTGVLSLRAQRQAPRLAAAESDLLLQINEALPAELQQRYQELIPRRRQEILTAEEHAELLRLTDEVEQREAKRAAALAELAQLRKTSVADLLKILGIQAPAHG